MNKLFKILGLSLVSVILFPSCGRRNLEYLVLDDFLKSNKDCALLGSIKIIDEIRGVDLGYLLYASGAQNREEHYFYFDRTSLISKFEGPYKFNAYSYKNNIDDICSFIVDELNVKAGFELMDKLVYRIEDMYLYENNKPSGFLTYNNLYKINESNYDLSLILEDYFSI